MNDTPAAAPTTPPIDSTEFFTRVQTRLDSQLGRLVSTDVASQVQIEMLLEANAELEKTVQERDSEIAALKAMLDQPDDAENTEKPPAEQ